MSRRFLALRPTIVSVASRFPTRAVAPTKNVLLPHNSLQSRHYGQGDQKTSISATASSIGYVWPRPFKMMKNYFVTKLILPKIDQDFNLTDFMIGAKKAIEVISHLMSKGDYLEMEKFVEPLVVASVKESLKDMSLQDQLELAVDIPDIMASFPYSVEALFRTEGEELERRIDILVVCHILKGWGLTKDNPDVVVAMPDSEEVRRKVQFVNYQFTRTYVQSSESSWLVTGVHHFKPNLEP